MTLDEAQKFVGLKVVYPVAYSGRDSNTITKVKEIDYDNGKKMILAYLTDGTMCNIEILKNEEGKYIDEL